MKGAIRTATWLAYTAAIGAFTVTPLMGFVVADKQPSLAATALQMLIAVLLMLIALGLTIVDQRRRASVIRRNAVALAARTPGDRFAGARTQAHDAGLPWVESDGSVSWPEHDLRRAR